MIPFSGSVVDCIFFFTKIPNFYSLCLLLPPSLQVNSVPSQLIILSQKHYLSQTDSFPMCFQVPSFCLTGLIFLRISFLRTGLSLSGVILICILLILDLTSFSCSQQCEWTSFATSSWVPELTLLRFSIYFPTYP